ncbi:MAG: hypothetical protein BWY82_02689 [Verrucomicrobia bacterium ADurb.Bin474]|nr:MAG: hypothetical protein BWY82_02689 [Verrucomicrobia bacterium ADurb.Bin474]
MTRKQLLHSFIPEPFQGALHTLGTRQLKVHATHHHMHWPSTGLVPDMRDRVQNTGVRTPQNDHQTFRGIKVDRHVIRNRIRNRCFRVEVEGPSGILKQKTMIHFAAYEHSRNRFSPILRIPEPFAKTPLSGIMQQRNTDATDLSGNVGRVFLFERSGMHPHWTRRTWASEDRFETAHVIVVPVTQHNRIRFGQVDAQHLGVVPECHALSRVKKETPVAGGNPPCQTMLPDNALPSRGVFNQKRNRYFHPDPLLCLLDLKRGNHPVARIAPTHK